MPKLSAVAGIKDKVWEISIDDNGNRFEVFVNDKSYAHLTLTSTQGAALDCEVKFNDDIYNGQVPAPCIKQDVQEILPNLPSNEALILSTAINACLFEGLVKL